MPRAVIIEVGVDQSVKSNFKCRANVDKIHHAISRHWSQISHYCCDTDTYTHTQTEKGLSILFLQDLPTDLPQVTHLHTYTHNSSCMKTETTYGVTTSRTTPWAALPAYLTFHCLPYLFHIRQRPSQGLLRTYHQSCISTRARPSRNHDQPRTNRHSR